MIVLKGIGYISLFSLLEHNFDERQKYWKLKVISAFRGSTLRYLPESFRIMHLKEQLSIFLITILKPGNAR